MILEPSLEVAAYLSNLYLRLPQERGPREPRSKLRISPSIDPMEAADFLSGQRAALFTIDELGYAQSPLLPSPPAKNERQKLFQLFWHRGNERFLFREGVCQLAAASALVVSYGWPKDQVRLEPNKSDLGDIAYGVDLIVTDRPGGDALIFGEVKRTSGLMAKLIQEVAHCGSKGAHAKSECGNAQHRKFAACWAKRPEYFWAVCPAGRKAFRLVYKQSSLDFVEIRDIPSKRMLP